MSNTFFIVDVYNLIYRMFYAIPEMTTRDGLPVNAIFGVAKFLKSLADENPDASLLVATDVGRSFREEIYPEYKAQRDRMPDNLRSQIDGVFALFDAAKIRVLARPWYEADDIIGSIVHKYENNGHQVVIISSDKDLCQFVRDGHVHIYDAMKRKFMKESDVTEKFGVPAHQVCDYLAIVGDSSDNIPGISGFGPKKAVDLLSKYETLEGIYEHLEELTPKMQDVLLAQKENAFLSQKLATIDTSLIIDNLEEIPFAPGLQELQYRDILKMYEFKSLFPQVPASELAPARSIDVVDISTYEKLSQIHRDILGNSIPMIVSVDEYGKMVFSIQGVIYRIDTKKVDVGDFIEDIINEKIPLIWYDLKDTLKKLYTIKKPAELAGDEGQGRLF